MEGWMKCTKLFIKPSTDFLGIDEVYKIGAEWNVRNWLIYCVVWIWILQNLRCLSCKSINFVLIVKPTLWWRCFGCSGCVCVLGCLVCIEILMLSFIKLGCIRVAAWKEIFLIFLCLHCAWYTCNFLCHQS